MVVMVVEGVGMGVSLRHVASHSPYVTGQTPRPLNSSYRKRAKTSGRGGRKGLLTLAPEPLGSLARSWSVAGREQTFNHGFFYVSSAGIDFLCSGEGVPCASL